MNRLTRRGAAIAYGLFVASLAMILATEPPPRTEKSVDFTLSKEDGTTWKLSERKAKVIVVVFLSTECPMANGVLPKLGALASREDVELVGILANPDDDIIAARKHREEFEPKFSIMRDPEQVAVRALEAKVTPEAFVLDEKRILRYRGRIDDGFTGRMKAKPEVTREDLKLAIDALLAGKKPELESTEAFGCKIVKKAVPQEKVPNQVPTYHKDIVPVINTYCLDCHRSGQVGPFALSTFKQVTRWADTSLEEIEAGRMPPWKPEPNVHLAEGRALPKEKQVLFRKWFEAGMPEGNPGDAPPTPKFPDDDWRLGKPDLVLELPEPITIGAEGRDHFRVVAFPTNLKEDQYLAAVEIRPGNRKVVHHTLELIDTSGRAAALQKEAAKGAESKSADRGPGYGVTMGWGFFPDRAGMVGGWAPGMLPKSLPAGIGQKLPKGSDFCIQYHFHRTGKVETEKTRVGLYFMKEPLKQHYRTIPVAGLFRKIPAGEKAYHVETSWKLVDNATFHRLTPHMHMLGKQIELTYTLPGGKETQLLKIPAWDYNWQEQYDLKKPLELPKGTLLTVRAVFDNSRENPSNPFSPPQNVTLGEQTTNEMCFVFVGVSTDSAAKRLLTPVWGK